MKSLVSCCCILIIVVSCIFGAGELQAADAPIRLLVRADDIGSSHAANVACIRSYREGIVRSVEIMVPCPWFNEAVAMLKENPGLDTPEMRAIGHDGYRHVAADRDGVTRAFTSEKVKTVVKRRGIQLISYGDVNREPFDVDETGDPAGKAPLVQPWRHIPLDPEYGGAWVVAGDLDGDGSVEIVSARNVDQSDVHYTSAVVAQRLDGSVLWRWGNPKIGRKKLHHDVACQIHDWDNDGRNEVVLCAKDHIVALDGATGKEKRRIPLPKDASDCLVFARLSDKTWASDVLVKTRYGQIWAFDRDGKELWTVKNPGGFRTAHQPVPIDLDGDGIDEVMAGYAMLNADGTVRWVFKSEKVDIARGHVDCCRMLRPAKRAEDIRLVLTCCGANNLAVVDGHGKTIWEVAGHHYESVDVGRIRRDVPGVQIAVDIDHRPWGQGPIRLFDADGRQLGQIMTDYARHHALVDWTGDGLQEILVAQGRGLFDGLGRRIATLAMPDPKSDESAEMLGIVGDMTGDGVPDVILTTRSCSDVYIYKNERGKRPAGQVPLGTGANFTLY